jgi:hypothetical protein
MAMVGKYGVNADGTLAGGTLRLPGQINAESEVQGMSRKYFMGRIPIADAREAAVRMGLPEDAYAALAQVKPRAALDYSQPTPGERELFVCLGTQFESNMMGRRRWVEKLENPGTRLVVIDPIPDPFTLQHAELVIPSPPHPAAAKLYQNGEWKMTLSVPQKQRAPETRTDATIVYDVMAEITRRLESETALAAAHPDLSRHVASGYLRRRFCPSEGTARPGLTSGSASSPTSRRAAGRSTAGPIIRTARQSHGRTSSSAGPSTTAAWARRGRASTTTRPITSPSATSIAGRASSSSSPPPPTI